MIKRNIILFFLIDALGWEWLKEYPFLEDLAVCRQPTKTVLGFSCSAIPAILTGKTPEEHGRWNLLYFSPDTSPFAWTRYLHFLPESILESRVVRKGINVVSKRLSKSEGYFSSYGLPADKLCLFDLCEKKNIYRPGGVAGNTTIIDYLENNGFKYRSYSYHNYSDAECLMSLCDDISDGEENVYFAYLAELDDYLHHHCDEKDLIADKLNWYDAKIRKVHEVASERCENVHLFVFSDHGMTPVTQHFDLIGLIKRNGIDLDLNCLAVFDSTMARFWVQNEADREKLLAVLATCTAGKVLDVAELKALKVFFPDGRYGNVIFLMHPGTLISPNVFGTYSPQGMHGFHPDDANSHGAYLSNVDNYQPVNITDIFAIMKNEADRANG